MQPEPGSNIECRKIDRGDQLVRLFRDEFAFCILADAAKLHVDLLHSRQLELRHWSGRVFSSVVTVTIHRAKPNGTSSETQYSASFVERTLGFP